MDVDTGRLIRTLTGHTDDVTSVSFSPDGQILASGSYGTIRLWDVDTGRLIRTLFGHTNRITRVLFSPDGQILASWSNVNTIRLWDVDTGRLIRPSPSPGIWVGSLASRLVQMVRFWQVGIMTPRSIYGMWTQADLFAPSPGIRIRSTNVSFSPDGQTLTSGSYDNTISLWDVDTGRLIRTLTGIWVGALASRLVQMVRFWQVGVAIPSVYGMWTQADLFAPSQELSGRLVQMVRP